jgi:hypothetical protein
MQLVPSLVAISITRELGPLVTAIVVIGRSGSAFAAEIGTMRVTEELDALKTMALDPISFLVVPKFLAMAVMLPCLAIWSDLMGVLGGGLFGVIGGGFSFGGYLIATQEALLRVTSPAAHQKCGLRDGDHHRCRERAFNWRRTRRGRASTTWPWSFPFSGDRDRSVFHRCSARAGGA